MRSVNQNHNLYVVKAVNTITDNTELVGTIQAVVSGDNAMDKDLYFLYKGRDCITRSDLIPVKQITYVKKVDAENQRTPLKKVTVILDKDTLDDDGNAIVGMDYILNIEFQQFYGLSPEDTYVKTVGVHVTKKNNTPADFFASLVDELNASFSREVGANANSNPYLDFAVSTVEDPDNSEKTVGCLVITEKEQPWSLGKWEAESLIFNVFPSAITVNGVEMEWGVVTKGTASTSVPNTKRMADLEWFTFAERADFYRGMGYPNNFDFIGLVDSTDTTGYDALEIHYAYQGTCEDIQKSEKDITLIAKASDNLIDTLYNSVMEVINAGNGGNKDGD